ncbi:FAD binding domain protein [Xylariaceae sp. FL1272]|nr:FAD binding domain protein [Xylariaceae sp. FL1272]
MTCRLTRYRKMEIAAAVVAWALTSTCRSLPSSNTLWGLCPRSDPAHALRQSLSPGAQVYLPGTSEYDQATNRWSVRDAPHANIVVVPSVETDVATTVKYANSQNMSFLATNGGHGAITTVGRMQGGIEIWLHQLSSVEVSDDGKTAKIGGGTLSKTITDTLWTQSKQTVTGGCECTSYLGPGLGGGHGFLQGRHGLIADQFVSMNVVFANGELRTIDKTSELFWAMQGAGHNFGIVTSVTSKIYDVKYPDWAYASFIYTGDKVEGLYDSINKYLLKNGSQPVYIINYSFFFNEPSLDPDRPLIMFFILQEGATTVDPVYTKPFINLGPIVTDASGGSYTDLPAWTGNSNDALPCQKAGLTNNRFPIDLQTYNVAAQRKVYDLFASATQETPALNGSLFLFEGYSLDGVKAIPSEKTAFPNRAGNLLVAPLITYKPGGPSLDKTATDLGESLREILYEASGQKQKYTYVNYAFGDESEENWYGFEQWRQDRLKELKKTYDPHARFSFYAPIR